MRLAEIRIENFRTFGEGDAAFRLTLPAGIAALVGENDSGKTAIVDAIRLVLGTRGQDYFRVGEADFHQPPDGGVVRNEIRILLRFDALSTSDRGAFLEHLTYLDGKAHLFLAGSGWLPRPNETFHHSRVPFGNYGRWPGAGSLGTRAPLYHLSTATPRRRSGSFGRPRLAARPDTPANRRD